MYNECKRINFLGGDIVRHIKTFHAATHQTSLGLITIEGPIQSDEFKQYQFHEKLVAFRPANKQFAALLEIADFEEGRIIVARTEEVIVGYVTYLYPDPLERWSLFKMKELMSLGAIEIIPEYRGERVASNLLKVAMMDDFMENYIIISTEYYWHWDLKGTKLSIWDYRRVMEKMMASGGLSPAPTDDPEIISHPANTLMVRIGKNVSKKAIEEFDRLRFLTRYEQRMKSEG